MMTTAAAGRQHVLDQLLDTQRQLLDLAQEWNCHRRQTIKEALAELIYQNVSTSTTLFPAFEYLGHRTQHINHHLDLLRRQGEPVPDELYLDLANLFQQALDDRRGTDTTGWALINALPSIERKVSTTLRELVEIESLHAVRIEGLRNLTSIQIEDLELSADVQSWHNAIASKAEIESKLAESSCRDAMWFDPMRVELRGLEMALEYKTAVGSIFDSLKEIEKVRLGLLRDVSAMGIRVKGRQRLMTEYFSKA